MANESLKIQSFDDDEEEEKPEDDDVFGDHIWHYRYNRRLSCFQNTVTSLAFSGDGQYLVSGSGSGDVRIWDTGVWAEAAKLRGCRKEEPRALAISPAQRWLVVAHSSVMNVYSCKPPFRLEHSMPAPLDMGTKESSEWCCIAFSPMSEVDHPGGHAGQDNHLAAFAVNCLWVLDYSGGFFHDTPKRTRSVFNSARPISIAYTACGFWLVCGYECGELQIWNHFSLTLERTLNAHSGMVTCITASPRVAPYDPRFVSCSCDRSLRVWHSAGWSLEQIAPDTKADRNGIRSCAFSSTGNWLISVASELCVWSVCVSSKGKLELRLHQRLAAVCGAEGLRTASFGLNDAIAVGSRDGVLGLWMKLAGLPAESVRKESTMKLRTRSDANGVTAWIMDRPLARPMMHVTPDGAKKEEVADDRRSLQSSEWFVRSDLRALGRTAQVCYRGIGRMADRERGVPSPVTPNIRAKLGQSRKSPVHDVDGIDETLSKSTSLPELKRWKPTGSVFEDALAKTLLDGVSQNKTAPAGFFGGGRKSSNSTIYNMDGDLPDGSPMKSGVTRDLASIRKSLIRNATQGIVQRMQLAPQSIC